MQYELVFVAEKELLRITVRDEIEPGDVLLMISEILKRPEWKSGTKILCDFRGVAALRTSMPHILETISLLDSKQDVVGQVDCAIVVSQEAILEVAKHWQALTEDLSLRPRVFKSFGEAEEWLSFSGG